MKIDSTNLPQESSKNSIQHMQDFARTVGGKEISEEEAREWLDNVYRIVNLLHEWDMESIDRV